jgi:hypothetical protein
MTIPISKRFPSDQHFAVVLFDTNIGCDGEGWWNGDNAVNYLVMTYEEIVQWVAKNKDRKFKVVEVYPMTVEIPEPVVISTKPYEMPPHLVEMKNEVLDQAREYAKLQRERLDSIQDPVMKAALIKDLKKEGW